MMTGILYIVGTPIGNLGDFSERGKRVLSEVDLVACEDTRVTRKLLSHFDIHTKVESFHGHSSDKKRDALISRLREGESIALVSDAGTPAISDPGMRLVEQAHAAAVKVASVPGPSAVTAALSLAGLPANSFTFFGFAPRKKGRQTFFKDLAGCERTAVFFESPHRFKKALARLVSELEDDRTVVVTRELTKQFESVVRGSAIFVRNYFQNHPDEVRGEFCIVISGK